MAATRFPGKPLAMIAGIPMVVRVWRAAVEANVFSEVVVATDSPSVVASIASEGGFAMLTSPEHQSGTDRCFEVAQWFAKQGRTPTVVVNVQGDEPLMPPELLRLLVEQHAAHQCDVTTPVTPITTQEQLHSPHVVKVVLGASRNALMFSRATIPYQRSEPANWLMHYPYQQHIGVYAYKYQALAQFVALPTSILETSEQLEQLRLLEAGATFHCVAWNNPLIAVDVPADVERVEKALVNSSPHNR
jgi:3-deoxy-manno-octulosonate cytidylyltransferase (CMP-KDO synthetase)